MGSKALHHFWSNKTRLLTAGLFMATLPLAGCLQQPYGSDATERRVRTVPTVSTQADETQTTLLSSAERLTGSKIIPFEDSKGADTSKCDMVIGVSYKVAFLCPRP